MRWVCWTLWQCSVSLDDGDYCLKDCTNAPDSCPDGTTCNGGICAPETGACTGQFASCGPANPYGACDEGRCVDGQCIDVEGQRVVEAEPTFSITSDIFWYGFIFTTASYSTLFNDQLNVFRTGSRGRVVPDEDNTEMLTFTNPISGVSYSAVHTRCQNWKPSVMRVRL